MIEPSVPETESIVAATPVSTPPPAVTKRRARGGLFATIVVLVIAGVAAWAVWRLQAAERDAASWQDENSALRARLDAIDATLAQTERGQQATSERIDAANATNRVLREELLGMGERAALLEDAVARLADQRLRGETVLRLNEAEFLLLLGAERLRLFGDPASAIQAFTLAEASLASLDDPALATLRQTLAQELIELRGVPADPRPQLRAELAALGEKLATLPASRADDVIVTDNRDSRLAQILSKLITVRHVAERDGVLGPVQRDAALAAVRLRLELAQAALARPDPDAFRSAMAQATASSVRLFDRNDAGAVDYFATLERLSAANLVADLPALGATLQELRGLRATRTVGRDAPALPAPATTTGSPMPADPATPAPAAVETPAAAPASSAAPLPDVERAPPDDSEGGAA